MIVITEYREDSEDKTVFLPSVAAEFNCNLENLIEKNESLDIKDMEYIYSIAFAYEEYKRQEEEFRKKEEAKAKAKSKR